MLTSNVLYTFKYERKYKDPTELVYLKECTTIKSAEEEINKENSFVISVKLGIFKIFMQKLESQARTFYMIAENTQDKESWIGAIG